MKVRILRSFVDRRYGTHQPGQTTALPEDADWVEAGLAEPVEADGDLRAQKTESPEDGEKTAGEIDVSAYAVGGGWYDVPGAEKAVRKDEAERLLQEAAAQTDPQPDD